MITFFLYDGMLGPVKLDKPRHVLMKYLYHTGKLSFHVFHVFIDFVSFCDLSFEFWKCSDSVIKFVFLFYHHICCTINVYE